jgi:hypothetical protein
MIFDIFTGILSALLIVFSLLFPFRRRLKKLSVIGKLKFHCVSGTLLLIVTLIHINFKLLSPYLSAGFLALFALILVVATGFLKRRFMKVKFLNYLHISFVGFFILTFLIHVFQQIINLIIM